MSLVRHGLVRQGLIRQGIVVPLTGREDGYPAMDYVAMGPGDSQTAFGATTLTETGSYWGWLRFFLGSQMNMVPDLVAGKIPYATGGYRIAQFGGHVAALIATLPGSKVKYAWVMGGTNDALLGISAAQSAADMRDVVCRPLKAAGIIPIVFAAYPMPLAVLGGGGEDNTGGVYSARIVAQRAAIEAMCAAERVPYYDCNSVIELSPGVANPAMMADDTNVHLGSLGASVFAREAAARLVQDFDFSTVNPLANTDYITPNADFASLSGNNPAGWWYNAGAGSITPSIVDDAEGRWWRLVISASASVVVWHPGQTTAGNPAGLSVDGIVRFRLQAGELRHGSFVITPALNGAQRAKELTSANPRPGVIYPSDGIKLLRTPIVTLGADANIIPQWNFQAGASGVTVDLQIPTVRRYV